MQVADVTMTDRDDGSRQRVSISEGDCRCERIARANGISNQEVITRLLGGEQLQTAGFVYTPSRIAQRKAP